MRKIFLLIVIMMLALSSFSFALSAAQKSAALQIAKMKRDEQLLKNKLGSKTLKPVLPEKKSVKYGYPLEFGFSLGLLANIPGGRLDLKWNDLFDSNLSVKTGLMYADGKDADSIERKHALIFVDGLWRLVQPEDNRVGVYAGGGLNYLALTTGHVSGAVAGEIYAGLDSKMGKSETLYVEMGFGAIRTGFSPTYKGLNAFLGYRTKI
ncbi:MAG: hypothetical protein WC624_01260 [Candidatus Margulisiibacteriota bacterium]